MVQYNQQQQVVYYHTSTTNKSFLEMARYLKDIGIKNYKWPLILLDPDLAKIDPFDPLLPQPYKVKVLRECIYNPIYFIRECVRIESSTPGGMKFGLHRGNMAIIFCMLQNINCFVDLPRQTGKTIGVLTVLLYWYQFGISNTEINFLHKKLDGATDNLDDLRKMRDLLPPYLRMSQVEGRDGKKIKEKSNVRDLQHPVNGNRIRTVASARNKVAAASQMRGRTSPIIYYDEFAFSPYNKIVYTNMVPAYNTAANNCKMVGAPYGIYMTTTPGLLTTDEGKAADDFRKAATPFDEHWYDFSRQQLDEMLAANSYSSFVYIRFSYQQLGKSEEWFRNICREMGDWTAIRREVLLEWSDVNDECPFSKEDLDTIKAMLRQPINTIMVFNKYPFKIYEQMDINRSIPILGVDVSAGLSRDYSTIVVIDSRTSRVTATFECNYISTIEFAAVIQEIVSKWMPRAVVNIERNGVATTAIAVYRAICTFLTLIAMKRVKSSTYYNVA
nr:MAG TPA: large terminase [Caudoviricetes sp.]